MENFASILERDYGFKSGKNAPMVSGSPGGGGGSGGGGYGGLRKSVPATRMSANAGAYGQEDPFGIGRKNEGSKSSRSSYGSRDDLFSAAAYDDVFGGPPKGTGSEQGARYDDVFGGAPQGAPVFDDLLPGYGGGSTPAPKVRSSSGSFHSSPRRADRNHFVPSEPAYDDLIPGFGFMPKSRSSSSSEMKVAHEPDPFVEVGSAPGSSSSTAPAFDEGLLPGFETAKSRSFSAEGSNSNNTSSRQPDPPLVPLFDEPLPSGSIPPASSSPFADDGLLPGFGDEGAKSRSSFKEAKVSPVQDSFGSLGEEPVSSSIPSGAPQFDDLLNVFNEPPQEVPPSSASSSRAAPQGNGVKLDRFDSYDSFPGSPGNSGFFKDSSRKAGEDGIRTSSRAGPGSPEAAAGASVREGFPSDDIGEASPDSDSFFPSQTESGKTTAADLGSSNQPEEELPAWDFPVAEEPQLDRVSSGSGRFREWKDAWLTIDDMRLITKPSKGPPPSRRPPPLPGSGSGSGYKEKGDARDAEFVTSSSNASTPEEDLSGGNAAAPPSYDQAVPGWMDFKIQPSREEEIEEARAARERRRQEREARASRENQMREREAIQAREQERLRREKEREKDKAAVRVATLEARERAAQEARERAERAAVERVTGEARSRAASQARARSDRAAVDRANAEVRERAEVRAAVERAAAEAHERAERAAAEKAAVERAAREARERSARAAAEKVAVERAQTEVRERAARAAAEKAAVERASAEARERLERAAAEKNAAARERSQSQRKSENDLESFFARSAPPAASERQRPASMNNNANVFGETRRTSSGTAATSASMDDWASIFGAAPNPDDSQDTRRGETGRTSRARNERQQHTRERAAKAIAEINQRDLETQREQAEKQRAGDVLDSEIKRWSAGKEGNLRALLSTLQYVLWPECGWTPVSLTDLINPASVKKTYRKATLYVHPDKVQQKGATVQQKYIAEKVFDLLKEASNKFNSEELF